ncbi:oxidoreductase [Acinetobacter baumannii]|nr:oxidoreductase [Acinetobacter baumannii]
MHTSLNSHEFLLGGDTPINRLGFGAMRLPCNGFRGVARDPEVGKTVLNHATKLGVNLIDTAEFYQSGDGTVRANDLIRDALHPYPPSLVIATKVGVVFNEDGSHRTATGQDMRQLIEENLKSLGLDSLDLVYLRIGEMTVPYGESIAERFEALAKLRQEGLIRHLGLSNIDHAHLAEAQTIAPVTAVQNHFSITNRKDMDLLNICTNNKIAFCPFFPLGGGMNNIDNDQLTLIAAKHGATTTQIALAWLLALSPVMLAIPGTGSLEHLEENMASMNIQLANEDLAELNH